MAKTFEHILVPFDGSKESQKSFKKAVSLAQAVGAKITVFTCIEKRTTFALFKPKEKSEELDREKTIVEKQHSEMIAYAKKHEISCNSKIVRGENPADEILSYVQNRDIDLIMMIKTKFVSHYEKVHHYNTIENVFTNTSCPVLILD